MQDKRPLIFIILIIFMLLGLIEKNWAIENENIIYPGKGIGNIIIGKPPSGIACGKKVDIEIICDKVNVVKIYIRSPKYYVVKSRLHVGSSIGDMFRYYEKGETVIESGKTIIKYPTQGIDFEINKLKEQIAGISIYQPHLPSFNEQYKKQFKQVQ